MTRKLLPLLGLLALGLSACRPAEAESQIRTPAVRMEASTASSPAASTAETVTSSPAENPATPTETLRQVRVVQADSDTLRTSRSVSVSIDPAQESRVASGASGRVERILKREGETVEAGETILALSDNQQQIAVRNAELALEAARINLASAERASSGSSVQLESQVRSARMNVDLARNRYNEAQALLRAGGMASAEVMALEAQLSQAQSALSQAEDGLARSRRSGQEDLALLRVQVQQAENGVAQARDALNETRIRAPFAGQLAEILMEEGEFVGAGSPVFRLVSNDRQLARFRVLPEDASRLAQQNVFYIRHGGLDYGSFIIRTSPVPGPQRLVEVVAEIYPSSTPIPPGTVAQLRYEVELGAGVLVPASAIVAEGGQNFVFVVEDGTALRRPVAVVAEAGGSAVLTGIPAASEVVHPLPLDLRDGTRVGVLR